MRLVVGGFDIGRADMRVDLCRHKALMAEQFLNAADIRATVEQMCCKAMAKGVRACSRVESTFFDVLLEHASDTAGGKSSTEFISECRWFLSAVGCRTTQSEVLHEGFIGMRAKLADTLFAPFTPDSNRSVGKVDVAVVHSNKFANPKPRAIGDFKDRKVSTAHLGLLARCVKQ